MVGGREGDTLGRLLRWKRPLPHTNTLKAGCETVAHILQVSTDLDEEATVVLGIVCCRL